MSFENLSTFSPDHRRNVLPNNAPSGAPDSDDTRPGFYVLSVDVGGSELMVQLTFGK
jgi:hypothetical protein